MYVRVCYELIVKYATTTRVEITHKSTCNVRRTMWTVSHPFIAGKNGHFQISNNKNAMRTNMRPAAMHKLLIKYNKITKRLVEGSAARNGINFEITKMQHTHTPTHIRTRTESRAKFGCE